MIKLKSLIEEIMKSGTTWVSPASYNFGGPTNKWETPQGTPDEVINILHLIMAEIIKRKKNAIDYVKLSKHIFPQIGRCWIIQHTQKKNFSLVFSDMTKQWYLTFLGWEQKIPTTSKILNSLIKDWMK